MNDFSISLYISHPPKSYFPFPSKLPNKALAVEMK